MLHTAMDIAIASSELGICSTIPEPLNDFFGNRKNEKKSVALGSNVSEK